MAKRQLVPAAGGAGLRLARGEHLRIIDLEGGQTGDLMAFSRDGRERLSNGRTFDYGGKIYVSTGDVLWSDRSNPMLTIVEDQVGRHDFLYSPCSLEMYRIQYGVTGYHANCHDNLLSALRELGIEPDSLPTAFNFFMNVDVLPMGASSSRHRSVALATRWSCARKWISRSRCRRVLPRLATAVHRRGRSRLRLLVLSEAGDQLSPAIRSTSGTFARKRRRRERQQWRCCRTWRCWRPPSNRLGAVDCSRGFVASWSKRFTEQRIAGLYSRHLGQVATVLMPQLEARISKPPAVHRAVARLTGARADSPPI